MIHAAKRSRWDRQPQGLDVGFASATLKALNCGLSGGAKGIRTPDPHTASVVRYQLRHSPKDVPVEVTPRPARLQSR
jgi:hypothetical protein